MSEKEIQNLLQLRNFLKAGRGKLHLKKELEREMKTMKDDVTAIGAIDYEKAKISGGELADLSDTVIKKELAITKLQKKMMLIQMDIYEWKEKVLGMIACCDDDIKRAILMERFISGDSWTTIQRRHNYGERNPYKLCNEAISEIARKYKG